MKIKLNYIDIENFKRIKRFRLELAGESAEIRGANETGKTTVADAVYWLVSDSNSDLQSNFSAITLDQEGAEINNLDACVEAQFFIGSRILTLKKIYKQRWTKKRGTAESEYSGHTTDYYVDSVPKPKKEYDKTIEEIIDPKLFRVLSDINYFVNFTKVDYRRKILMEIIGKISDADIIKNNPDLFDLTMVLDGRSPEDLKKITKKGWKKLDKELEDLPKLIAENKSQLPELPEMSHDQILAEIADVGRKIDAHKTKISDLKNGVGDIEKRKALINLESEVEEFTTSCDRKRRQITEEFADRKTSLEKSFSTYSRDLAGHEKDMDEFRQKITDCNNAEKIQARRWNEANTRKFTPSKVCITCGQQLPDDNIKGQQDAFNLAKADDIKTIRGAAAALMDDIADYNREIANLIDVIADLKKQMGATKELIASIDDEFENKKTALVDESKPVFDRLNSQIESLKLEMSGNIGIEPQIDAIEKDINVLLGKRAELEDMLLVYKEFKSRSVRIDKHVEMVREYAKQFEELERILWLLDEFDRKKAGYIEDTVSGYFKITKWKLFEEQINKGLRDICEPTYGGIPYSTNLNTGAKVNVGLDVVNTLGLHYDLSLPVFVDNSESITKWLVAPDTQMIQLVADADKSELEVRFEV